MTIRWDLFEVGTAAAMLVAHDKDIARDAALAALEELGYNTDATRVKRRARDRAKDALRRRQPGVHSMDMDTLPSASCVFDEVAERQREAQEAEAVGERGAQVLRCVAYGYSNLDIALAYGVGEETVRRWRKRAEDLRDIIEAGLELGKVARGV